ncbi:hypothetical protein ACS0TY_033075 [Phlomoides rotata]
MQPALIMRSNKEQPGGNCYIPADVDRKHCRLGPSCDHVIIMNGSYPKNMDSRKKQSPLDHIPRKNDSDQASYRLNDGWKADNGFKAGFQRELEKGMRKLLPGTDLVEKPHISSKIHVWKKEYRSLSDLLSKSGIGWNSTTQTIDVMDETVWTA